MELKSYDGFFGKTNYYLDGKYIGYGIKSLLGTHINYYDASARKIGESYEGILCERVYYINGNEYKAHKSIFGTHIEVYESWGGKVADVYDGILCKKVAYLKKNVFIG